MSSSKLSKTSRKLPWLAGALGLQLVLALVLFNVQTHQPTANKEPLLAFNQEVIDGITLEEGEKKIQLLKKADKWKMEGDLSVADGRVEDLLKQLSELRGGWAVGTSREAAKRFEVSDDQFKRRVRLLDGDKEVASLFVGTSPNFRHLHVRQKDDAEIYSVKLEEFALSTDKEVWLDVSLLQPEGEINALQYGDQKVEKVAGHWPAAIPPMPNIADTTAAENAAEESAEQVNVTQTQLAFDSAVFAKALSELTVLGLEYQLAELDAPYTQDVSASDSKNVLKIEWTVVTDKGQYHYQLLSKNDQYYIRRTDIDSTFRVSKTHYDALAKIQDLKQS